MRSIILILLASLQLAWTADRQQMTQAGIDEHAKAAYFVLRSSGYVFALNVAENGDVYFHMNAPARHSWVGVGFGSSMHNTRMIVSYISEDGHRITNSPRMSRGQVEPEWEQDVVIDDVQSDLYAPYANTLSPDGIMIAHAVCRNCSTWATGSIDTTSTSQPFIFALGPNITLRSNELDAPLRLHDFHGSFELDMTVATNISGSYGRVPPPQDPGLQVGHAYWAFANTSAQTLTVPAMIRSGRRSSTPFSCVWHSSWSFHWAPSRFDSSGGHQSMQLCRPLVLVWS